MPPTHSRTYGSCFHPAWPSGPTRFILTRTKNLNNEYGATGRQHLLPPAVGQSRGSPHSSQSRPNHAQLPTTVREYSCTQFFQSAYLVTPQQLQYENIPAQNSLTRHILSHLNIYSHKMNNEFTPLILSPGMNGIRTYTNFCIQLRSGRRLVLVPVHHVDDNQSVHSSNTNEANSTTEQNTQTAESGNTTVPEQSQVNTSQNHTDSPN